MRYKKMKLNRFKVKLKKLPLKRWKYWNNNDVFWDITESLFVTKLDTFKIKLLIPLANYFNIRLYIDNKSHGKILKIIGHKEDLKKFTKIAESLLTTIKNDLNKKTIRNKAKLKKCNLKKYRNRKSYKNLKPTMVFIEELKNQYLENINLTLNKALAADIRLNRRKIKSLIDSYIKTHIKLKNKQKVKTLSLRPNRLLN